MTRIVLRAFQVVALACWIGYLYFLINGEHKPLLLGVLLIVASLISFFMKSPDTNRIAYRFESALEQSKNYLVSPLPVDDYINESGMTLKEIQNNIGKGVLEAYEYDEFLFIETGDKSN